MYSKTNYIKGNFIKYNDQLHLIFEFESNKNRNRCQTWKFS